MSRVSSLRPAPRSVSPPAPSLQAASAPRRPPPPGSLTESPQPSLRCRSRAARGAAASGFSRLLTSLCTLLASAEKCPPGRWPPRDLGRAMGNTWCGAACFVFKHNFRRQFFVFCFFTFPGCNEQINKYRGEKPSFVPHCASLYPGTASHSFYIFFQGLLMQTQMHILLPSPLFTQQM